MDATEFRMLKALCDPAAYPDAADGVERVTTHISYIFLAGDFAYKVKRPVSLGFVDFSTLLRRRFYCEEELRLNRRLAAQLYLDVVPITDSGTEVRIDGKGDIIDYAVRMRRFPQECLLSAHALDGPLIDRLAERVARFHLSLTPAPADAPYGEPQAVLAPMRDNFKPIRDALGEAPSDRTLSRQVDRLERWTGRRYQRLQPQLHARRRDGAIRECHGDMHRGNIVVIDGEPVIFDCIEFNPSLRWIDTISEVAFLTMDLAEAGEHALARRFLNRYLEITGDYAGLGLLRFYQVYRALVRAKVSAIALGQRRDLPPDRQRDQRCDQQRDELNGRSPPRAALEHYLALARRCSGRHRPQLFITHGLSGSGKTWLGHLLREHLPIIQLRSDIERKRLFGIPEEQRPEAHQDAQLYGADATQRTYQRLLDLADELIGAGFSVLVDATFLTREQRAPFETLAQRWCCRYLVLVPEAPIGLLRHRVQARDAERSDASDADLDVLERQLARVEPLTDAERGLAVFLDTRHPLQIESLLARVVAPVCNGRGQDAAAAVPAAQSPRGRA